MLFPLIIKGQTFFVAQKLPSGMVCRDAETNELILFVSREENFQQVSLDSKKHLWGQGISETRIL